MILARPILLALILTFAGLPAAAHEQTHHDSKKASVAKKEQKKWGVAGEAQAARRVIEIKMTDNMRFSPDTVEVRRGDTVKFVLKNTGKLMHEMVIGTRKALHEHAELMLKFPGMEHEESYMAHVAPGKSGEIVWTFNRAGEFMFACLIAGHYQAGMIGTIKVVAQ